MVSKKFNFFILIGIVLFIYLIYSIGLDKIIANVSKANILLCLSYTGLVIATSLPKAVRMNILLKTNGKSYTTKKAIEVWLFGFFLGNTTPGRAGDFFRVVSFEKDLGIPKSKGFILQFADRLLDVLSLIIISLVSSIFVAINFSRPEFFGFSVFMAIALLLIFLAMYSEKFARYMVKKLIKFLPKKYKEQIEQITENAFEAIALIKKESKKVTMLAVLSMFLWLVSMVSGYVLYLSIGVNVSPIYIIMFSSISGVIALIPVTLLGLGTSDALNILLYSLVGVGSDAVITERMLSLFYNTFLFGAISFIFYVKHLKSLEKKKSI